MLAGVQRLIGRRASLRALMVFALFCLSFSVGNPFVWVFISCGSRLGDFFGSFGISGGVAAGYSPGQGDIWVFS